MDVVNINDGHYQQNDLNPTSSNESENSDAESCEQDSSQSEEDGIRVEDLKRDLLQTIPQCYLADTNAASSSTVVDDEFQAAALCQFMDILNDLDEVLDKSLLACLDDDAKDINNEDDSDLVAKVTSPTKEQINLTVERDDNDDVISPNIAHSSTTQLVLRECPPQRNIANIGRSKSFTDLSDSNRQQTASSETSQDSAIRGSMRRLDPIVLPAITDQGQDCEPLTLPVILFLEHNVNLRPISAPIQLQVTAANLSGDVSSGPLIVGRRTLLMNRALSLPSPVDSDVIGDWHARSTSRSMTRSGSTSSSSTESLNVVMPSSNTMPSASEPREEESGEPPLGVWPHSMSSMLACLSCTVGLFNISRFAMFSVHFGANFVLQFFVLSLLIGVPLFTLYLCLGQVLESGPVDMWRISPIFQGVGIAILFTQAVIGVYSIIGISWILVYFRDSFITAEDKYKWQYQQWNYEDHDITNGSFKIQETLPQYFHAEVLQRNLASNNTNFGTIKFQVAFNLTVVWMIVFVSLSKGLRSYGKAVYVLMFITICGTIILCTKLLTLIPYDSVTDIFSETQWSEFFINSNSWVAATQETFLTWGLLGACVMQLTSHKNVKSRTNSILKRESLCIVSFTFAVLLLAAFLANTCVQVLKSKGLNYVPGSFENVKSSQFLYPTSEPMPGSTSSLSIRYLSQYASLVGVTVWKTGTAAHSLSGWQPLQLATGIVPATLAVLPVNMLSPVWAILFYFVVIAFGIAQQLALWHCVITGIMAFNIKALKIWETTITFLSCLVGMLFGLILSTDAGIRLVHAIDYVTVGLWFHCLIQISLICGVFIVRGRPYSGEVVVAALYRGRSKTTATLAALLSFTWNVILPVVLCAICVIDFRAGQQRLLYNWRKPAGYWPIWSRQLAVLLQQGALLLVPVAAFVQTWRYMSKGPPDILDDYEPSECDEEARIQNLYRPRLSPPPGPPAPAPRPPTRPAAAAAAADPPPKYTPPPSYSTATGALIINTLRRSFRNIRRITSRAEQSSNNDTSQIPISLSETIDNESRANETQPPQYIPAPSLTIADETDSRARNNRPSSSRNSLSLTRDILRRSFVRKSDSVKSIRSSLRRSFKYGGPLNTSHEHLVRGAEPISNTVAMTAMLDTEGSPQARSRASVI